MTERTEAAADEIESQRETIRSLRTALDDLTRAGLEMERAKNDEIERLRARVAEMERDLDACRVELLEARHTVGEGWFAGGATLAEAIERKCRMLEDEVEGWQLAARGWP